MPLAGIPKIYSVVVLLLECCSRKCNGPADGWDGYKKYCTPDD